MWFNISKKIQIFFLWILQLLSLIEDRISFVIDHGNPRTRFYVFILATHVARTRRCFLRGQERKGYGKVDGFELTGDGRRTNYFLHIRRGNRNREKWVRSVFSFDLRNGLIAFFFWLFPFFSPLISAKSHLRRFVNSRDDRWRDEI